MSAFRGMSLLLATLGLLSSGWVALGQIRSEEGTWRVTPTSNMDDATGLLPPEELRKATHFSLYCDGSPPSFSVEFYPGSEPTPWDVEFEGVVPGTLWIGGRPGLPVDWGSCGRVGICAALLRTDVEALMGIAGAFEIEAEIPGRAPFHREFGESGSIVPAMAEFLEACEHHARPTNRQFEVDGIEVDLRIDVDDRDIEDLRRLANDFGIHDIERIYVGPRRGLLASGNVAEVRGREVRRPDSVSRVTLEIGNTAWRSGSVHPGDGAVIRGEWQTGREYLQRDDRWIVRDGAWSVEVAVGPDVSHEVTARIVAAIRNGWLVDARSPNAVAFAPAMPSTEDLIVFGPKAPPRITRARDTSGDDEADESEGELYDVSLPTSFGSGRSLTVRIVDDRVEVVRTGFWII